MFFIFKAEVSNLSICSMTEYKQDFRFLTKDFFKFHLIQITFLQHNLLVALLDRFCNLIECTVGINNHVVREKFKFFVYYTSEYICMLEHNIRVNTRNLFLLRRLSLRKFPNLLEFSLLARICTSLKLLYRTYQILNLFFKCTHSSGKILVLSFEVLNFMILLPIYSALGLIMSQILSLWYVLDNIPASYLI